MRTPSKHELCKQSKPETAVFVQDVPEGNAPEQSPTVSALGSKTDASQLARSRDVRVKGEQASFHKATCTMNGSTNRSLVKDEVVRL